MSCKIGQFVINPSNKASALAKILISQPSRTEESLLGRIFVIAELTHRRLEMIDLVNFIFNQINQNFYTSDQIILLEKTATITVENIFETAINDLNGQIFQYLEGRHLTFSPDQASLTIGLVWQHRLYSAGVGQNKALLVYRPKTPDSKSVDGYNLLDVGQKTAEPVKDIFQPDKCFANIVKGSIPPSAAFIFTNEALYEFLAEKQFIKIISTLPPAGAAQQLNNVLEQTVLAVPFLALIIKNVNLQSEFGSLARPTTADLKIRRHAAGNEPIHMISPTRRLDNLQPEKDTNKESIRVLNETEAHTAHILKPSGLFNFQAVKNFLSHLPAVSLSRWWRRDGTITIKRQAALRREVFVAVRYLGRGLAQVAALAGNLARGGWRLARHPEERREFVVEMKNKPKALKPLHWIILGVVIIGVTALSISLAVKHHQQQLAAQVAADAARQNTLNQKFDQLSGYLIYNNSAPSKSLIQDINNLIGQLPTASAEQKKFAADARQRADQAADQIYNVTRLAQPTMEAQAPTQNRSLNFSHNRLLALAADGLYALAANQAPVKIATPPADCLNITNGDVNTNFYCLSHNELVTVDTASAKTVTATVSDLGQTLAGAIYNNKLYLLNSDGNINRYTSLGGNGFANKTPWLTNGPQIGAKTLTIDGTIFLGTTNAVTRYLSGQSQSDFQLGEVYPPLTDLRRLITNRNSDYLVALDPANQRLILYDKKGALKKQYIADAWKNLQDVALSDDGKTIYVLADDKVYSLKP